MHDYFMLVLAFAALGIGTIPITWLLSKSMRHKWTLKQHYWFFIGYLLFSALLRWWGE